MAIVIRSFGKAVPKKKVLNSELPENLDTSDEWIRSHTGIGSRYIAGDGETCLSLGVSACKQALVEASVNPEDVNLLICSTTTPTYAGFPSTACVIQPEIGAVNATCFDITAACTGFLYALNNAAGMMELNNWKYAVVCGSEILTQLCDWNDRSTCILFGDGASAVVLEKLDESEADEKLAGKLGCFVSGSDGSGANALYVDSETGFMKMDGHAVYNFAVGAMTNAIRLVLEKENLSEADVDYFVCHQANERILSAAAKRLGFDFSKFVCTMGEYGNTSSASIPLTLADMKRDGKIKKGTTVVSAAFGAGLTWAGTVIRF
ncbi:MAG: ketoacyl-ACP synthase III [Treponema sp.]|nr:ketoacyl-ACP synthase III [Treponema sp.]